MTVLLCATRTVPLREVRIGDLILCDGSAYKVFRLMRVTNTGGWLAMTVTRDRNGGCSGPTSPLYFPSRNVMVRLLEEVPRGTG